MNDVDPPANRARPGRTLLLIGAILLVAGVLLLAIAALVGYAGVSSFGDSIRAFDAPGQLTFDADEPATYRLYSESGPVPDAIDVRVTDADGNELPQQSMAGYETYTLGARRGDAFATVDLPAAGTYTATATSANGASARLAVGPGVTGMVGGVFAIIGGACLGVPLAIAGLVLLIVGFVKRSSAGA